MLWIVQQACRLLPAGSRPRVRLAGRVVFSTHCCSANQAYACCALSHIAQCRHGLVQSFAYVHIYGLHQIQPAAMSSSQQVCWRYTACTAGMITVQILYRHVVRCRSGYGCCPGNLLTMLCKYRCLVSPAATAARMHRHVALRVWVGRKCCSCCIFCMCKLTLTVKHGDALKMQQYAAGKFAGQPLLGLLIWQLQYFCCSCSA